MTGAHSHATADDGKTFAPKIELNVVSVAVEAGYGFWPGSLTLLADAGHNLSETLEATSSNDRQSLARTRRPCTGGRPGGADEG